jgi:hypothetical protein
MSPQAQMARVHCCRRATPARRTRNRRRDRDVRPPRGPAAARRRPETCGWRPRHPAGAGCCQPSAMWSVLNPGPWLRARTPNMSKRFGETAGSRRRPLAKPLPLQRQSGVPGRRTAFPATSGLDHASSRVGTPTNGPASASRWWSVCSVAPCSDAVVRCRASPARSPSAC